MGKRLDSIDVIMNSSNIIGLNFILIVTAPRGKISKV